MANIHPVNLHVISKDLWGLSQLDEERKQGKGSCTEIPSWPGDPAHLFSFVSVTYCMRNSFAILD